MIATRPIDILHFLADRAREPVETVLVTLVGIEGSSPRALGAQMAVAADGRYCGSLSGGCLDAAIVAEALDTLALDVARTVRFGSGSPYIDIRLPCGGGVDLLLTPRPDRRVIEHLLAELTARRPARLRIDPAGLQPDTGVGVASGWRDDAFIVHYQPLLAIKIFGQGEELTSFAQLARTFGADVEAFSPDRATLDGLARQDIATTHLLSRSHQLALATDEWTAIVLLFHDRDWEDALLPALLALPGFYVGAIGSPRTQAARLERLGRLGVPGAHLDRLNGPIGLIPATRDSATLSLSILSDVVERFQQAGRALPALVPTLTV